jgi:hypothetical protein
MADEERWAVIAEAPNYEVSTHGRVRRLDGALLAGASDQCGGRRFCVRTARGTSLVRNGHRLVLEAFCRHAQRGEEAVHLNGDTTDNRLDNLAWGPRAASRGRRVGAVPDMAGERWLPSDVSGYLVSDAGRVKSVLAAGRLVSASLVKGYRSVLLRGADGTKVRRYVHTLVLLAFHGPRPDGFDACHNDGDRENNAASNLRWDTRVANAADKRRHGTLLCGERSPQAKLTASEVTQIRAHRGFLPSAHLAELFGVSMATISAVQLGKTWRAA